MIDRGKRSKALNEVNPDENKNLQNFLRMKPV